MLNKYSKLSKSNAYKGHTFPVEFPPYLYPAQPFQINLFN